MANATFELTDGTTTLNLNGAADDTYRIPKDRGIRFPRPNENLILAGAKLRDVQTFSRTLQIPLTIQGSSVDGLNKAIRDLEKMLSVAAGRQIIGDAIATKVSLTYQMGTVAADDITMEVLHGTFDVPNRSLDDTFLTQSSPLIISGTLSLLCEPFGRLANVPLFQRTVNPEQDGNSQNFVEIGGNGFNAHLLFDGASGDITVSDAAAIQNQFDGGAGLSGRVYVNSDGEGNAGRIFDKAQFTLTVGSESSGAVKLNWSYVFSGTDGAWTSTDTVMIIGERYRVGIEYDNGAVGNKPTIYVYRESTRTLVTLTVGDGLTESSTPTGTRTTDVGDDFKIGNRAADDRTFDGKIDDVRWYGTAGNIATEDRDRELLGTETNLIHYWPMDEGFGITVKNEHATATDAGTITTATWGMDAGIVGDGKAPMRVKVTENGAYASTGNIWLATRSGERRTDVLWKSVPASLTEGTAPFASPVFSSGTTGGLTTNAEGGASAFMRWTFTGVAGSWDQTWKTVGYATYQFTAANLPRGLFRVLVRLAVTFSGTDPVNSNLGASLGYSFGGVIKTPVEGEETTLPIGTADGEWHWLDIGELDIPVVALPESDIASPTFDLRIHGIVAANSDVTGDLDDTDFGQWNLDSIFLLPIDESVVMFPDVTAAAPNRAYVSGIAETPGVWLLDESDVVDSVPAFSGGPLTAGPEATRLYVLKDDTGDPSAVSHDIDIEYEPQIRTL